MKNIKYETLLTLDKVLKDRIHLIVELKEKYKELITVQKTTNLDFSLDINEIKLEYERYLTVFTLLCRDLNLKTPDNLFSIESNNTIFINFFTGSTSTYRRKFNKIKKVRFTEVRTTLYKPKNKFTNFKVKGVKNGF